MNEIFFETVPILYSEDRTFMKYSIENRSPYRQRALRIY